MSPRAGAVGREDERVIASLLLIVAVADPCVAAVDPRGFVRSQLLDCATREMDRADAALDAEYQRTLKRLRPVRRARLRLAERRWITRRRATCATAKQAAIPSREINRMRCLVRKTEARTRFLQGYR